MAGTTTQTGSRRSFPWPVGGLIITTVVLYAGQIALRETRPQGDPIRLSITIALIAVVALLILTIVRRSGTTDEFEKQVQSAALGFAFPVSLAAVFAIGFLAGEGVLHRADPRDLPSIMLISYFGGLVLAWRKYR